MDPKKLPPAVLLALGLSACGRCGEPEHLGPCLSVVAPPQPEPIQRPCLSAVPDPLVGPPDTGAGPCLSVEMPPEEPPAQPCLSMVKPPPEPPPEPDIQPCLEPIPEDFHPCLSIAPPQPLEPPPEPEEDAEEGAALRAPEAKERQAALRRVISRDALPIDVIAALNPDEEA